MKYNGIFRQQREMYKEKLRNEHNPIARGLGAYDEYSDSSLARSENSIVVPRKRKGHRYCISVFIEQIVLFFE